ncbi:MAG: YabP/YqfC family sporulation protein [Clostridia bacterium]|nr:YabP/YqfC family sporulation protein [Clostridia bacterium]
MKLLEQIMEELGGDTLKSFSVVPSFGGYFRSIRSIAEYSSERIVLLQRKTSIILEGEKLEVGKYFEEDIFIKGNIKVITVE